VPLAFIPPRTLAAIIDGMGSHDATVTALAQAAPRRWDRSPNYVVDTTDTRCSVGLTGWRLAGAR
jgi:hypothetical protein